MMKSKILIISLAVILILTLFLLSRRQGAAAREAGKITLSYDICLKAGSGYREVENDTLARLHYLRRYWADSTNQYFSKTLASPEGDTLFVSVFNNAALKRSQELLIAAGFETLRKEQARADGIPIIKILARSSEGKFFLRYLIDAGRFRAATMADMPGRDSSRLLQKFESGTFIQNIEKCL